MERLVRFELLGQHFAFYTGAPEEEVNEIVQMVQGLVLENSSPDTVGSISVSKVAVLASLNMASKYVELKRDFEKYKNETETRLARLAEQISCELTEEKRISEG
ncbi:MAG: cell division protein ZapA [Proteobacteria bacterium]|nr:cell division protein ZapA [Pseudomonadota bacterium]MBU1419245.1 cell division protein ZapA [Pseudomonadota bacterium]MBU1453873.1 cell division protein ZapA [Pseudomonadota bacterium]